MNCGLQVLANGKWWCPACDKDCKRLLPRKLPRNCRLGGPVATSYERFKDAFSADTIRSAIEAELQRRFDLDVTKRTMEEMRATLDKCFGGGCDHMNGVTCTRRGSECRYRENWLLSIASADCEVG